MELALLEPPLNERDLRVCQIVRQNVKGNRRCRFRRCHDYFAAAHAESELHRQCGSRDDGLWGELLHAGGGLLVLLVTTTLPVYKPRGITPYGRRKEREKRLPAPGSLRGKAAAEQ